MGEQIISKANTNERRFLPATESSAKARLDHFRNGIKSFQKEHPEVLGATVYGSMIKGEQAKESSDVDAFLYIDKETLPIENNNKNDEVIESEYRENFLKSLNVTAEESSRYYGDLRSKLLDNQVLDNDINTRIEYDNKMKAYKKKMEEKYTYETPEEEKNKLLSQEPRFTSDFAISGMFHARVGSGIEKYRRLFLEKVRALPDNEMTEKIWKDVYFDLKTYEQRADPNKKIDIPETFNEALRVYHPDLYKNLMKEKDNEKISELKNNIFKQFKGEEKDTKIKEGVDFVFEQNPELSNIGTPEEYSNYLDTIFPNSKIKDIVYHYTSSGEKIMRDGFKSISELGGEPTGTGDIDAIFLTKSPISYWAGEKSTFDKIASVVESKNAIDLSHLSQEMKDENKLSEEDLITYKKYKDIFNLGYDNAWVKYKNPTMIQIAEERKNEFVKQGYDSILHPELYEIVVLDKKQTHVLGSEQDIKKFKEFVSKSKQTTTL